MYGGRILVIPKKIHYCWFGRGKKPKLAKKCIASWKKYCPDYEIIEWNEDNFDINLNGYTKMCYEQKKYAFLTDYIRLLVVAEHGGIYFDTDVEVVRPIDELLDNSAFFCFENEKYVATGLGFGAEKRNPLIEEMSRAYSSLLDGQQGTIGCPILNTEALIKYGLQLNGQVQKIQGAKIFSKEYFNPFDSVTGELHKTENTYSVHWYSASWLSPTKRLTSKITRVFHRIFGPSCFAFLKK